MVRRYGCLVRQLDPGPPAAGTTPAARPPSVSAVVGTGLAGGAAALSVALVDPSTGGWFPSCPLRSSTGVWCPVCGMTRAAHHLFQGEVLTAVTFHLFVAPIVVALAVAWVVQARRAFGRPGPPRALSRRWAMVAVGVLAVFTVVRNLPWAGVLRGVGA